jgi:hypothetical protein
MRVSVHLWGKARGCLLGLLLAVACGGSSKRQDEPRASGSGGDVTVGGTGGTGGTAGSGAAGTGADGGSGAVGGAGGSGALGGSGAVGGAGGSGALGGSGASSGSAGEPNDGCSLGEACSGETGCILPSTGSCCVETLVCEGGRFVQGPPQCGTTQCPDTIPEAGTACGPCAAICPYDTCSPDGGGSNIEADCTGKEWVVVDVGCLTCCEKGSDCESGFCAQGRCLSPDHGIGCFDDSECDEGFVCAGTHICPCGSPQGCKGDGSGECVPDGIGCCVLDADCGDDETCVAGVCKPPAESGRCWKNDDCDFGCSLVSACPCGMSCGTDEPGRCWEPL